MDEIGWRGLPKCELHAHLNGSVRESTLIELATASAAGGSPALSTSREWTMSARARNGRPRTMSECFDVFKVIGAVTTNRPATQRVAREMVVDAAADGIRYMEIRTGPKDRPDEGMSARQYVESVLAGVAEGVAEAGPDAAPAVALLLSLDRARTTAKQAVRVVELAAEFHSRGVVGIDIGGNPAAGDPSVFVPAVDWARNSPARLPLAAHVAELPNMDADTLKIMEMHPARLGHAVFLGPDLRNDLLQRRQLPVEVCLTSNLLTESTESLAVHPGIEWLRTQHPVALSTDDWGVFETTLSREFAIADQELGPQYHQHLVDAARQAIRHAFQREGRTSLVAGPPESTDNVIQWFEKLWS